MATPGPSPTHTLDDVLAVFRRLDDPGAPLTASDVAAELGCVRRTAFDKLEALEGRGDLRSEKVGARGRVWWRPAGERDRGDPDLLGEVLETAPVGVVVVDASGDLVRVNDRATEILGIDGVEGYTVGERDVYDEEGRLLPPEERPSRRALRTGETVVSERVRIADADGDPVWLSINAKPVENADGDVERVVLAGEEITRVKEQSRRLKRQRDDLEAELDEVFDRVTDAFYALDEEWRFTHVNERAAEILQRSEGDLLGENVWTAFPEAAESVLWEKYHDAMATQEPVSFELFYDPLSVWAEVTAYPSETGLSVYFRDVTERKTRERALEASETRYRTLAETATDAIVTIDADGTVRFANRAVEDVFGHPPDDLVGESVTTLMPDRYRTPHREGIDGFLETGERRIDWTNVEVPGLRRDGTEIDLQISFADYVLDGDRYFTGIIRDVTGRKERERELASQRERLAALNQLNGAVQRITHAVIGSSTRDEIETLLCERLAASGAYRFAWSGSIDREGERVRTRAQAGVEGPLADVPLADAPSDGGPTDRAVRTGEMQVARHLRDRSGDEDWRTRALRNGARAIAVIPIEYEDALYGVLTVGTERPEAFGADERTVVGRLGEVVGHALTAIERKRALLSETRVELQFRVRNPFDAPDDGGGEIALDRPIPIGDGEFLQYGTAPGSALDALTALVERLPHVDGGEVIDGGDDVRFVLALDDPPVVTAVASRGGRVESATVENGDLPMVASLPAGTDVRDLIEAVEAIHPDAEVVAKRRTTRTERSIRRIETVLREDLTDRQRTVLETALAAGFFEWPRDSTGEEIAESLDIAPSTFHQHVRRAERKLVGALFERDPASEW